jgi:hypothetical protein
LQLVFLHDARSLGERALAGFVTGFLGRLVDRFAAVIRSAVAKQVATSSAETGLAARTSIAATRPNKITLRVKTGGLSSFTDLRQLARHGRACPYPSGRKFLAPALRGSTRAFSMRHHFVA